MMRQISFGFFAAGLSLQCASAQSLTPQQLQQSFSAGSTYYLSNTTGLMTGDVSSAPISVNGTVAPLSAQIGTIAAVANAAVPRVGGDITATTFTPPASVSPTSIGAKLARMPDPRDFGALGNAVRANLSMPTQIGDTQITVTNEAVTGGVAVSVGWLVLHKFAPHGTVVTSVTQNPASASGPASTTLTLSQPITGAVPLSDQPDTYFDFAPQDDTAAFVAAYNAAKSTGRNVVHITPGFYPVTRTLGPDPTVTWEMDNAMLTQNGGIADGVNAGMEQQPAARAQLKTMSYKDNENLLWLGANFVPSNSNHSIQKNVLHIQIQDGDPSCFQDVNGPCVAADGAPDIGRGAVGLSIQASPTAGNMTVSLFAAETLLTMPANTDGAATTDEFSLVNNVARDSAYLDDINNKFATTMIGSGSTPLTGGTHIGGAGTGVMHTGIWIDQHAIRDNAILFANGLGRDSKGNGMGYAGFAWIDANGGIFGQSAHFGGGPSATRTLPSTGLTIDTSGNLTTTANTGLQAFTAASGSVSGPLTVGASAGVGGVVIASSQVGQIDLGASTLAASSLAPALRFHRGSGSATDAYDLAMQDVGSALRIIDGSGNQLAYFSAATGMQGTTISTSNTNGVAANLGNSLALQLTSSGFDMLNEISGKGLAVHTAGGYNATFKSDGSTSFAGPVATTAQDGISASGSTQAGAVALATHINRLTACGAGAGVSLPAGAQSGSSLEIVVLNRSANACLVYPPAGGTIESNSANAAVSIAANADQIFRSLGPTAWYE